VPFFIVIAPFFIVIAPFFIVIASEAWQSRWGMGLLRHEVPRNDENSKVKMQSVK
jgi:hypothetical protein